MINMYFAPTHLQQQLASALGERELLRAVLAEISQYQFATQVNSQELDLAFAAAGGPSHWLLAEHLYYELNPPPQRAAGFGDILVESASGYVNLATPAGFIPLVDVEYRQGHLQSKQLN